MVYLFIFLILNFELDEKNITDFYKPDLNNNANRNNNFVYSKTLIQ